MSKYRFFAGLLLVLTVLAGSAGPASAKHDHDDGQEGLVSAANDNNVQVPAEACHNDVPVNALGVQVTVKEIFASLGLPVLSDESPAAGPDTSCDQNAGQENDGGQENQGSGQDKSAGDADDDESLIDKLLG